MDRERPSVSILVPIYRVEKYIERCARSLFEQSYDNLEYIFVDDCSPDQSVSILMNILEEYPNRKSHVKLIRHPVNKGLAGARNTAVDNCMTDFLIHVDSDDYIDNKLVEECVNIQLEKKCDIVLFDYWIIHKNCIEKVSHAYKTSVKDHTIALLSRHTPVCVWSAFYNTNLYKMHDIRAIEGINNNEDYQVTPKLSYYSDSITYLNIPLYYYDCTNEDSITHGFSEKNAEEGLMSIKILKDFFEDKGNDYLEAINNAEVNRYATYIKNGIQFNKKQFVYRMKTLYLARNLNNIKQVPLNKRVYLLSSNYSFLYIYTKIGLLFWKILKLIKRRYLS